MDPNYTGNSTTVDPPNMPESPEDALPLALLFSFGVIGALFLLMLILIGITIGCCVAKKRLTAVEVPLDAETGGQIRTSQVLLSDDEQQTAQTAQTTQPASNSKKATPQYSQVIKLSAAKKKEAAAEEVDSSSPPPPLPPPPVFVTPSPTHDHAVRPQEIASYNTDIPQTFIPYAPPPPISGLTSTDNLHRMCANSNESPYNIPVDALADYDEVDSFDDNIMIQSIRRPSRALSFQGYPSQYPGHSNEGEGYYDTVHEEEAHGLTMSLQVNESHYKSPRCRQGRYSQGNNPPYSMEPTYVEALEPSMLHSSVSSIGSEALLPYAPIYDCPRNMKKSDKPLEISSDNIMEIQDLGTGRFGPVVLAATVNLTLNDLKLGSNTEQKRSFLVAVKKLKSDADTGLKTAFQEEINFLSGMKHANVIRLLGVCSLTTSPFIIVEYMENGDLHEFLCKQKLVADDTKHLEDGEATPLILLYMAVQISSGMRYLASKKFIHRDLATRNCLVGREFVVKISDFGMSQKLYESYYYRIHGQLILPIRWMPYESFYGKFSIKSDVWAFGVTLWEIYQMAGCEPYGGMSDEELIHDAMKGKTRKLLERPKICPQDVYDLMLRCWVHEPSVRADFEEIYSRLFLAYMTKSQDASY